VISHVCCTLTLNLTSLVDKSPKGHGGSGFGKSEPSTYACSFYAPSSSSRPPIIHFRFDVNGKQSPFPTKRSAKRCIIFYKGVSFECLSYCGRDKGMPNGWSFNWESMATRERGKPEDALCRELGCCLCTMCVLAISNRCQTIVPLPVRG
jgi:hypothetical protein